MNIHIVVDDSCDGNIKQAIIGAYSDEKIANAVAYHPYTALAVITVEVDTLKGEPVLTVVSDQKDRPHSRACPTMLHDHGIVCAPDCPTCQGSVVS